MGMVHSRRPLALASSARACAMIRATLSRSQTDPVLFLPHQTGPRTSHLVKPQRHQWRCHRPRPSEANALQGALLRGILLYHLSPCGQLGRGTRAKGGVPRQALRCLVQQERGRRAGQARLSSLPSTLKGVTQLCQQQIRRSWAKRNSST